MARTDKIVFSIFFCNNAAIISVFCPRVYPMLLSLKNFQFLRFSHDLWCLLESGSVTSNGEENCETQV